MYVLGYDYLVPTGPVFKDELCTVARAHAENGGRGVMHGAFTGVSTTERRSMGGSR